MKTMSMLCSLILGVMLTASPITVLGSESEPISIETDTFSYYASSPEHLENMEGIWWRQNADDKLTIRGTEANFLVTGIYQEKNNPEHKIYTGIDLWYSDQIGRGYFNSLEEVAGSDSVQVGDLLYILCGGMESNPLQFGCNHKSVLTNYGNACDTLGDDFIDVIRHELVLSQFYGLGKGLYDKYELLPVAPEIGEPVGLPVISQEVLGDFNKDNIVNASDATSILIYAAEQGAKTQNDSFNNTDSVLTSIAKNMEAQKESVEVNGDFNKDGVVNASDASIILIYAAEYGAGTFSGTFEEYVNR